MFPQLATGIAAADNLSDNIAKEALAAEATMEAAGAAAQGGPAKLREAVLQSAGPAIDQWVASRFPDRRRYRMQQKLASSMPSSRSQTSLLCRSQHSGLNERNHIRC